MQARFAFPIEYVRDIEASKRFYTGVLGFNVERGHPVFVEFRDAAGNGYAIATDEQMEKDVTLELYWTVDDIEAAYNELSGKAEISTPIRDLPFGRIFGVRDPDGQPRYLLQWAAQRPSAKAG
ncbi:MAG: VOC family protein [Hyphomicrobiales bacterium]